ncbi:UNVERIFIED_CONTAM: hypothetical protein HDU68_009101 [Siphonaria sp. JEL0065]|nr:hypothetical protein HDU68_009101 [Siphonaria sp. JEL0065]
MSDEFEFEDLGEGPSTTLAEVHSNTSFARRSFSRNRAKKGTSILGASAVFQGSSPDVVDEPLSIDNQDRTLVSKSVRRTKSGTIHDPDAALQYADALASEQATTIKLLEAAKKDLISQLAVKDKTIFQLKKVESINSTLSLEVVALKKQLESFKNELHDSQEKLKTAKADHQKDVAARSALVMEDTKKSILIKRLQDDLEKANEGFKAVVDKIVSEKESATGHSNRTKADLELVIATLRDENKSLLAENQSLKEENERNEQSLKQILLQASISETSPPVPLLANTESIPQSIVTTTRSGTKIPPRSTSAISLINILPVDGSLEIQMLKQRAITAQQVELQRLKEENQALISQLSATLNSINQNLGK